jgi:hypothetical protein
MGFEDEAEQSFGRPCRQSDGRTKRTCELTSSIVPRGTSFHCSDPTVSDFRSAPFWRWLECPTTQFVSLEFPLVRSGSIAVLTAPKCPFRSTPNNGHKRTGPVGPFGAKPGSRITYSITSSARPISGSGISRPSALAVLRLMTSSTFVDCCTGKFPGFSPLRMRPA